MVFIAHQPKRQNSEKEKGIELRWVMLNEEQLWLHPSRKFSVALRFDLSAVFPNHRNRTK
jgi:hypothetical protein